MMNESFKTILLRAIAGEHEAIEKIMDKYKPLIDKYSIVEGQLDEDCRQYILIRIALQINKFNMQE